MIWEEHLQAFDVFCAAITQWRMGPAGPIGLDYAVIPQVARDVVGIRKRDMRQVWAPLQVMEGAALAWFSEQREQERRDAAN